MVRCCVIVNFVPSVHFSCCCCCSACLFPLVILVACYCCLLFVLFDVLVGIVFVFVVDDDFNCLIFNIPGGS